MEIDSEFQDRELEEFIMDNINMKLVKVNGKIREYLLVALADISEIDSDFNEDKRIEYLWDMEYLLDTLKDKETDKEFIEEYVSKLIGAYYKEHILEVIYDENGKAECIALATMGRKRTKIFT